MLIKLRADTIFHAGEYRCSLKTSDLEGIYEIEKSNRFIRLSPDRRYNIYLQYARALQEMHTIKRRFSGGRSIVEIITHCFNEAIKYQIEESMLTKDDGWKPTSELVSFLMNQANYGDAIKLIEKFMQEANFSIETLTRNQRGGLIRLLISQGDALCFLTGKNGYRESEYITSMADHPIHKEYWNNYTKTLNDWKHLYPSNSRTEGGRRLYTFLSIGNDINKAFVTGSSRFESGSVE